MAQRSTQRTDILSAARCSDILPESYLRNLSNLPVHRNIAQIGQDAPNRGLAYSTKFRCTCQDKFHFFLENVESIIKCRRNRYGFSCIIFLSEGRRKEVKTLNGYSYLTLEQRREIERMYAEGERVVDIAARLKRSAAAIYEELKRGYTGEFSPRKSPP